MTVSCQITCPGPSFIISLCAIFTILTTFCAKYRLFPLAVFLNQSSLQASTFDSPKKERRLPKKWRSKNYNKDVKTTLQVIRQATVLYKCVFIGPRWSPAALWQVPSCIASTRLHASNPNLSTAALSNDKMEPESLHSAFDMTKLQEDFCRMASNCEFFS